MAALSQVQASRIVQAFSALEDEIDYLIVRYGSRHLPSVLRLHGGLSEGATSWCVMTHPSIADAYGTIKVLIQDYDLNEIYRHSQRGGQPGRGAKPVSPDQPGLRAVSRTTPPTTWVPLSTRRPDSGRAPQVRARDGISPRQQQRTRLQAIWRSPFARCLQPAPCRVECNFCGALGPFPSLRPSMATSTRLYEQISDNSEALVMQHLGLVKRVALHLKVRIPPFMELDELIPVGMIGLLEAARAFNPDKGVDFENFALSRVRGAILDEVRQLSYLPRSAVAFNKSESRATRRAVNGAGARANAIGVGRTSGR
jgi:hypothetical protein